MSNVEDVYALTAIQEGMLYHSIQSPTSGVFVQQMICNIDGELDRGAFRSAWDHLIARHSALRTCYLWDGLDEPLQVVRERVAIPWREEDWREFDAAERMTRLDRLLAEDCQSGFALDEAPLMRMRLLRIGLRQWRWLWTFHHLVIDGWSLTTLMAEVSACYRTLLAGATPPSANGFAYRDYIAWYQSRVRDGEEAFWRSRFDGYRRQAPLVAYGAATRGRGYGQWEQRLAPEQTRVLQELAQTSRVTLNTVIQAAFGLCLGKYLHTDDLVFGVTVSGRTAAIPGLEEAVGSFINTLPLRQILAPRMPLRDWLRHLQQQHLQLLEWESSSLVDIQRWAGLAGGQAIMDAILVFENVPMPQDDEPQDALRFAEIDIQQRSNYPLALIVIPGPSLRFIAVHDRERLSDAFVRRFMTMLVQVLAAFCAEPMRPLGAFGLHAPADPDDTAAREGPHPEGPWPDSVLPAILACSRRFATRPAVEDLTRSLSYADLEVRTAQLADALRGRGLPIGARVGIHARRGIDMIVALLGTLRAGCAYVPLDPGYPRAHTETVIRDAGLALVLTTEPGAENTFTIDAPVLTLEDALRQTGARRSETVHDPGCRDAAYVLYTSGSTGRPKGVVVSHAALAASNLARIRYYGNVGRFLLQSSFAFDSSVAGIFWTLSTGGTLLLPAEGMEQDMGRLLELIRERTVTHTLCLPSLYQLMLDSASPRQLRSLQTVIVAGERCPPAVVRMHFGALAGATRLFNEYGPTEATVWSTVYEARPEDGSAEVPIGTPVDSIELRLVDQHGMPVPDGVAGEIVLGGRALASGYLDSGTLSAERFRELPAAARSSGCFYRSGDLAWRRDDGNLVFLGRRDAQVKIRGHRIELPGIEQQLLSHPDVAEVAVVASDPPRHPGPARILAFVTALGGAAGGLVADDLARHLRRRLPDYSLPDVITELEALPRLANGKVNYHALPVSEALSRPADRAVQAPSTETERLLAAIWAELLGLETLSVTDSFFELGGDSIISIQMISRARQAGLYFEPGDLVRHHTVESLAAVSRMEEAVAPVRGEATGDVALLPIQHWFFDQALAAPQQWNLSGLFEIPPDTDTEALSAALRACWRHHDALRTRFLATPEGWRAEIAEDTGEVQDGPILLDEAAAAPELAPDEQEAWVREEIAALQAAFKLETGPLLLARRFRLPGRAADRLLIAVHHLVVDAVSWSVLLEDIESAYSQAQRGEAVQLPQKTTSLRSWSQMLGKQTGSGTFSGEVDHWVHAGARATRGLPTRTDRGGAATVATANIVEDSLDSDRTLRLLGPANEAYATRTDELLITALVVAHARMTGNLDVTLSLEWHGRPDDIAGVDLSRTVGWFTASYPVCLSVEAGQDWPAAIKSVKEQLRRVPGKGLGYGALRYLADSEGVEALRASPTPELLFNYLGRAFTASATGRLRRVDGAEYHARHADNTLTQGLEINAFVDDDRLRIRSTYCTLRYDAATAATFSAAYLRELQALIDHCGMSASVGFTPSDFPEVDISQADLDDFLDGLA